MPALNIDVTSGIFIGDFFGFLLALPISLGLAYWFSAVKSAIAVVIGAFVGALLGFLVILFWANTLTDVDGASVFFGSLLLCSILGLSVAILTDLLIASRNARDYRRRAVVEESH